MRTNVTTQTKDVSKSRRRFLAAAAASPFAFSIVPRHVLGGPGQTPPSERVNVAGIGAGGQGGGDIGAVHANGANIVALCDVDEKRAATFRRFPKAKQYKDFRIMLQEEEKNIDAVTVGTPDHTHAPATKMAIQMGKHVYCEKPLTKTIYEARLIAEAARKHKVVTQMGNQGHASEGARLTNEWIQAGIIGDVREVHVWTDRAGLMWKQGIERPHEKPSIPSTLAWDLWLGPAAERPYNPAYVPSTWRGWWDFGTGALGDMGCHIIDHPVWALKLGFPTSVQSHVPFVGTLIEKDKLNKETYPLAATTYYEFPARGNLPAVNMIWYDGGLMPPQPAEMPAGQRLPSNGVLYVGSKGKMWHSSHGGMPQLLPAGLHEEAKRVAKSIPRSAGHHKEWVEACKGNGATVSNFDYAGPMTETVLLGNLAMRAPGKRLEWDGQKMTVKNAPELNQFVHREYRKGWTL